MADRETRSRDKRVHIIATAAKLFAERGYEATTVANVGQESGAAVGSITHLIGDKRALAAAAYNEVADRIEHTAAPVLNANTGDVCAAIAALHRSLDSWARQNETGGRLLLVLASPLAVPT